jgi:hypothetical protein
VLLVGVKIVTVTLEKQFGIIKMNIPYKPVMPFLRFSNKKIFA